MKIEGENGKEKEKSICSCTFKT